MSSGCCHMQNIGAASPQAPAPFLSLTPSLPPDSPCLNLQEHREVGDRERQSRRRIRQPALPSGSQLHLPVDQRSRGSWVHPHDHRTHRPAVHTGDRHCRQRGRPSCSPGAWVVYRYVPEVVERRPGAPSPGRRGNSAGVRTHHAGFCTGVNPSAPAHPWE